jgi:RNA polymerase sigma-70 factor (ECF subfamily)
MLSCGDIGELGPRLRYKVGRALGFACPDIDDVVQETLKRFLESADRVRTPEAAGAYLNGICRNVIFEYRRRMFRDAPMPEVVPEPPPARLADPELFELRDAIAEGMRQLSPRDRQVLRMFYLEELPVERVLELTGLSEANFRVVLCRAKERFRQIYRDSCNILKAAATS